MLSEGITKDTPPFPRNCAKIRGGLSLRGGAQVVFCGNLTNLDKKIKPSIKIQCFESNWRVETLVYSYLYSIWNFGEKGLVVLKCWVTLKFGKDLLLFFTAIRKNLRFLFKMLLSEMGVFGIVSFTFLRTNKFV